MDKFDKINAVAIDNEHIEPYIRVSSVAECLFWMVVV